MSLITHYCPTCKRPLSNGAAIGGKTRYFCTNIVCEDRFKSIAEPKFVEKSER